MLDSAIVTVSRVVTAAAGVFAPGHVGELTRYLPFELVDAVLEQTKTVQARLRVLPSRVGVYFLLGLVMFPRLGYRRVWDKLTAGLAGLAVPRPSEKALRDLRRRLGPAPVKALFEVVAGPLGQPRTAGVAYRGLRTVVFDGLNSLRVPDTDRNRSWLGRIRYRMGFAGYPTLRLMTLVETGTRGLLGASLGSGADRDEVRLAGRLLPLLGPGMLVLADRAFDANRFLIDLNATGAKLLVRSKSTRKPPVLEHLSDGSYLSDLGGLAVRVIDADLAVHGADGSYLRDRYQLITTLTDHHHYPAIELIKLYHERWEIEIAYLGLRHTILDGHVLRSGDRPGLEQEVWALLTLYQLLRMAMVDAVETCPGTDPDRASFTTALQTARDQLINAAGICPKDHNDLAGVIGRAVLDNLLPPRRLRYSARTVKCGTSRYRGHDPIRPQSGHHDRRDRHPRADSSPNPATPPQTSPAKTHNPHPKATRHRDHRNRPPTTLERSRTCPTTRRQTPQHTHSTSRMGPPRLPHPNPSRHLHNARHATTPKTFDPHPTPLTTRHWIAKRRRRRP